MQIRTLISVLILVAFLPFAVGCSPGRQVSVVDDPIAHESAAELQPGGSVDATALDHTQPAGTSNTAAVALGVAVGTLVVFFLFLGALASSN